MANATIPRAALRLRAAVRTKLGRAIFLGLLAWVWMALGIAPLLVGDEHATLASAAFLGMTSIIL